jgi:hypothetical protein
MNFTQNTALDAIMRSLFEPYKINVTDVSKISNALIERNIISDVDEIVNDHIAFRTLGVKHLGIASIEKIFLHYGYEKKDYYHFDKKKLDAFWYAPPSEEYPRIFISELRVGDLSAKSQKIIASYTDQTEQDPIDHIDLDNTEEVGKFFYEPIWQLPSIDDYLTLAEESEYAAWVIYNRYYLNHYTISVHNLMDGYNTLEEFNALLEEIGIQLNDSGGVIKKSKDGLLKQSSSVAKMVEAEFRNGEKLEISGSYVEFAERLPLPQYKSLPNDKLDKEHRRDGFESANADKIFESTYSSQTGKQEGKK